MVLQARHRVIEVDKAFAVKSVEGLSFTHHVFTRLSGKDVRFVKVDFRYTIFDCCYLRNCTFDSCDFTGCRFANTSLHGSAFTGCKFDYAVFDKTMVDSDILDNCCPGYENVKARFARTLRTNYHALGDVDAANKAILVELEATEIHLHKAWKSKESYYRRKYGGWKRFRAFVSWTAFMLLDFVWGNGERPSKLVRTVVAILMLMALLDAFLLRESTQFASYANAVVDAPQVFLGLKTAGYPGLVVALVTIVRLVVFGLFVSILVRRLAQR